MNEALQDELDQISSRNNEQHNFDSGDHKLLQDLSLGSSDLHMSAISTIAQSNNHHGADGAITQSNPAAHQLISILNQSCALNRLQSSQVSHMNEGSHSSDEIHGFNSKLFNVNGESLVEFIGGQGIMHQINNINSSAAAVGNNNKSIKILGVASAPVERFNNQLASADMMFMDSNELSESQQQNVIGQNVSQSNGAVKILKQDKYIDNNSDAPFEEEEVIPEIIEAEDSGNDDHNSWNAFKNPLNLHKQKSSNRNEENKKYMVLQEEDSNATHDLEAHSPHLQNIQQQNDKEEDIFPTNQLELNRSSKSTVIAEGEHHIQINKQTKSFNYRGGVTIINNLCQPYQSMEELTITNQLAQRKSDWTTNSMHDGFMKMKLLDYAGGPQPLTNILDNNQSEIDFQKEVHDILVEIEEEQKDGTIIQRDNFYENTNNPIEEEFKCNLQDLVNKEQALQLQRGRGSVLDEVDDDDIVNQNSSKSSSKNHSQERMPASQMSNIESLSQSTPINFNQQSQQEWVQPQIINQRNLEEEFKEQSEPKNHQQPAATLVQQQLSRTPSSNSSKRRSGRKGSGHRRFTYFAASGLSDDRWLCPICLDIYEDAVETPCCHNLFCEECIKKTPTCPLCNLRIIGQLKPNIPIRRLVLELSVSCLNEQCDDIIRKGEIDKHLKVCPFTPCICPNNELCGKIIRRDLDSHKNESCPYRIVECLLKCGLMLPLNDMEDHIQSDCPKTLVNCKNKCGSVVERGEAERHISIECPLEIVDCPNKGDSLFEDGCSLRMKRKEMDSHKLTCNFRRVYCPNQKCNAIIIYKDLHSHDERCLFKIIDCDNKCGQKIQRQELDKHKEVCEFQLVKCPYYDLGCKIEILRKDYIQHLHEEAFNHSIIFIEGQKTKNREIDELKNEINIVRQNYEIEIMTMFLELNRVKEDMSLVKNKIGLNQQNNESQSGPKIILGLNSGLPGMNIKKDERRYELPNSSANSSVFEMGGNRNNLFRLANQGVNLQQLMNSVDPSRQNNNLQNKQPIITNAQGLMRLGINIANSQSSQSVEVESNAASLAASVQSLVNNQSVSNVIQSQQFGNSSLYRINNQPNPTSSNINANNNSIFIANPFTAAANQNTNNNRAVVNNIPRPETAQQRVPPIFSFSRIPNESGNNQTNTNQGAVKNNPFFQGNQQNTGATQNYMHQLFGENSTRGRIPMIQSMNNGNRQSATEIPSSSNMQDRKNQMQQLFLASFNASIDSQRNQNNVQQQLQQSYQNLCSSSTEMRDFWRDVSPQHINYGVGVGNTQSNMQRKTVGTGQRTEQQPNSLQNQHSSRGQGGMNSFNKREEQQTENRNVVNVANPHDLDSSNVLYDDDFEIEEEKQNY